MATPWYFYNDIVCFAWALQAVSKYVLPVMCTVSNRHQKMFVTFLFSVTQHRPLGRKPMTFLLLVQRLRALPLSYSRLVKELRPQTTGAFLWDDLDKDQWSVITRIMVDQTNRWIHSGQGFGRSFDLPWSEWSRITDPYPDHPKGRHPTRRFMWQTSCILLGLEHQYVSM